MAPDPRKNKDKVNTTAKINGDEQSKKEVEVDTYLRRKVFFIHGTDSDPKRWSKYPETVKTLMRIANCNPTLVAKELKNNKISIEPEPKKTIDCAFSWEKVAESITNNIIDRIPCANELVEHVKKYAVDFDEIVLIGHSHGGNVAIQAADRLAQLYTHVYVLTVATPAQNTLQIDTTGMVNKLPLIKQYKEHVTQVYDPMISGGYTTRIVTHYVYKNIENPANWEQKSKITHMALWNSYDRVDGMSLLNNKMPGSLTTMTGNSDKYSYNPKINIEICINLKHDAIIKEYKAYINELYRRITLLEKLRIAIERFEQLCVMTPDELEHDEPVGPKIEVLNKQRLIYNREYICLQDATKVVKPPRMKIEVIKYMEVPDLPPMKEFNFSIYRNNKNKNSQTPVQTGQSALNSARLPLGVECMFDETQWKLFITKLNRTKYTTAPSKEFLSLMKQFNNTKDSSQWDFRTENIKKIDDGLAYINSELMNRESMLGDRSNYKRFIPWWSAGISPVGYIGHSLLSYIDDGIDNHSFDTAAPDKIEEAIDDGRIKPFKRVLRSETVTTE